MREKKQIRCKWLTIRLSEAEEKKLIKFFTSANSGSLSEYARDVILRQPVTILYRNESADQFLFEMIQLKKELNAIGNNFNQAVHKLHTLDHIVEIKAWLVSNEIVRKTFLKNVEEVKEKLSQIYIQWSQK